MTPGNQLFRLWEHCFLALILGGLTLWLGYKVEQSDFIAIIIPYFIFFGCYLYIYKKTTNLQTVYFFISVSLVLRLLLLFSIPNLSDDIYRFIWDGRLIINGFNPFEYPPSYYVEQQIAISGITKTLYQELNSQQYFTIYPPVCQGIFAFASWCFPQSIMGAVICMKSLLLLFETGSLYLLFKLLGHFNLPLKDILLYALNPLIIIELAGNLHFEAAMIFFLLLAIWLFIKNQLWKSAIAFSLAIASKLIPLMFLPFFIKRLVWKKSLNYFSIIGTILLILFAGVLWSSSFNFGESLGLYFQKFEFNGSIYYLLRWVGFQFSGYNLIRFIGPGLALIVAFIIFYKAAKEKELNSLFLIKNMLLSFTIFLLCTTTVMPWYLSFSIAICIFTPYRFPIVWSALIFLTYINYSYSPYYENLWLVSFEYILLFIFIGYELKVKT